MSLGFVVLSHMHTHMEQMKCAWESMRERLKEQQADVCRHNPQRVWGRKPPLQYRKPPQDCTISCHSSLIHAVSSCPGVSGYFSCCCLFLTPQLHNADIKHNLRWKKQQKPSLAPGTERVRAPLATAAINTRLS